MKRDLLRSMTVRVMVMVMVTSTAPATPANQHKEQAKN